MTNAQTLFEQAHALMQASDGGNSLSAAADAMKAAADLGHPAAANNYGAMLQYGRGIPENLALARQYYAMAAEQGLAEAQFNLGFMWLNGLGGETDQAVAYSWFLKAASQDDGDALTHLGRMAMLGDGTEQNFEAAYGFWERGAITARDNRCAFNLGVATAGGHGKAPDFKAALDWFRLAEKMGNQAASAEIDKIKTALAQDPLG